MVIGSREKYKEWQQRDHEEAGKRASLNSKRAETEIVEVAGFPHPHLPSFKGRMTGC